MKLIHYIPVIVLAAMVASCTVQGPDGPAGPAGANGAAGANGNANVYANTYTVTSWVNVTSATNKWISTQADSNITNLNTDAIEVYWSSPSDTEWLSMPHTNLVVTGDELSYGFSNSAISFIYYGNTNASWPTTAFDTTYFNVIVIPQALQNKYPNTDWQNAAEVCRKIPEVQAALYNANNK